jgi:hypothetical protein
MARGAALLTFLAAWPTVPNRVRIAAMTTNRPNPEVLSLLICDQIITDRLSGKQSLIGMFSVIHATKFPVNHPQLSVFASLTGGHGDVALMIRIVDANEERTPLVQGQGKVQFGSPLAIANLALQFHGLTFLEPGEYRVQLLSNGELLREARLRLMQARRPPTRPQEPGTPPQFGQDHGINDVHGIDGIQGIDDDILRDDKPGEGRPNDPPAS